MGRCHLRCARGTRVPSLLRAGLPRRRARKGAIVPQCLWALTFRACLLAGLRSKRRRGAALCALSEAHTPLAYCGRAPASAPCARRASPVPVGTEPACWLGSYQGARWGAAVCAVPEAPV